MNAIEKKEKLESLYAPFRNCTMCPLGNLGRINVVFGEGNVEAKLFFSGEAPGEKEDILGRPFIGLSGKLFTKILTSLKINRTDVFIGSIVKCRPPKNRTPKPNEIKTCTDLILINQLKIIKPKVFCALGTVSTEWVLQKKIAISKIRGEFQSCALPDLSFLTVMPTYHPAYLLRNRKAIDDFTYDIQKAYEKALKK